MKKISSQCFLGVFALGIALIAVSTAKAQTGCVLETICLTVVSGRAATEGEKRTLDESPFPTIAVRMRLSNDSGRYISYLSGQKSVHPLHLKLSRVNTDANWNSQPNLSNRSEKAFIKTGISGNYNHLLLPPYTSIEFNIYDSASAAKGIQPERAYSIFVNLDPSEETSMPVELISNSFHVNLNGEVVMKH